MRGIRFEAEGRAQVVPLPVPAAGPGEVVVAVTSTGVCGSDLSALQGKHIFRKPPLISGHEAGGIVHEIGEGVTAASVGDRVVIDPQRVCGQCTKCNSGRYHLCPRKQMLGISEWDGSFADLVSVPEYTLIPAPDRVKDEHLALAEPIAVAVHAVNRVELDAVDSALVLGGGTIGSLITRVLTAKGVTTVDVVEPRTFLEPTLAAMGASEVHEPGTLPSGPDDRYDAIFIAAGVPALLETAFDRIATGGTIIQVAVFSSGLEVPVGELQVKEISFLGTAMYIRQDFIEALEIMARYPEIADLLVTRNTTLEEGVELINDMAAHGPGDILKLVMVP
ncbi:zinc-binding dehydrogenase [Brachybacterium sp. FME24]|uniref:zinc-dependent alcohol dehydrogenase n=1 Tax=Brachybacterium sp. FME24 TaxID=2742605 RepID=UPI00186663DD|nr:alcohol dehydrogenase catalytic domain-containing protein [Brachybacterium sp. FME24]